MLVLDDWSIYCAILLIWMSWGFTDDRSTLIQVMAWCGQATSHYLNQCWPRSKPPYGITRPQWVNPQMDSVCGEISSAILTPSTPLIQVMAWCPQATSHYLNPCWPRSKPPYGITKPQWVNPQMDSVCGEISSAILTPSTPLIQVMAWCRQATSHYLNPCWPRSKPPYGITRPQWVNPQSD